MIPTLNKKTARQSKNVENADKTMQLWDKVQKLCPFCYIRQKFGKKLMKIIGKDLDISLNIIMLQVQFYEAEM